ncbi:MAG: helix-turn-helix transcriptional regulator [Lachnospiraceae bacterium]
MTITNRGGKITDIGTKIKDARVDAQLTQEQVEEILGVSRQTISNMGKQQNLSRHYQCHKNE